MPVLLLVLAIAAAAGALLLTVWLHAVLYGQSLAPAARTGLAQDELWLAELLSSSDEDALAWVLASALRTSWAADEERPSGSPGENPPTIAVTRQLEAPQDGASHAVPPASSEAPTTD